MINVLAQRVEKIEREGFKCEAETLTKLKRMHYQLFAIETRLKPYKRDPPIMYYEAKNFYESR